jgi:hypothetical protein
MSWEYLVKRADGGWDFDFPILGEEVGTRVECEVYVCSDDDASIHPSIHPSIHHAHITGGDAIPPPSLVIFTPLL